MDPGSFRYKVAITRPNATQNTDYGDMNTATGATYYRFCHIIHQSVDTGEENSVQGFQKKIKFIFRYEIIFKIIDETSTITYNNEKFVINGVRFTGNGNRQYVEILAKSFN